MVSIYAKNGKLSKMISENADKLLPIMRMQSVTASYKMRKTTPTLL